MKRRSFLKQSSFAAGAVALPGLIKYLCSSEKRGLDGRKLVMIQLKGGNDGLNTLVPWNSEIYYRNRPSLAINPEEVLKLNNEYGLNSAMKNLQDVYEKKNMLFINSVGFEKPESSHYTAFRIWQTGCSCPDDQQSWMTKCVGRPEGDLRFFNADTIDHNIEVEGDEYMAYSASDFETGLKLISASIASGSVTDVYHISLDGFDTHQMQRQRHDTLLEAYSTGVKNFVDDLTSINQFDNTLIITYSEFGRSIKENNKKGTEHGNANCLWVIGSKLKHSGIYNSDIEFHKDGMTCLYSNRDVIATVMKRWLSFQPEAVFQDKYALMNWI